jgi:hypothetical protein
VTDTTAWAVDGQQFLRFLTAHPPMALALLSSLSRLVITQNGLVDDMLFLDLKGRVAKRLLELATTSWHAPPGDGTVVDWGLPQADLAYLCGGTRANVSRVLSEFGRRGLIERSGRQYILRNVGTPAPACRALRHQRTTTSEPVHPSRYRSPPDDRADPARAGRQRRLWYRSERSSKRFTLRRSLGLIGDLLQRRLRAPPVCRYC